MTLKQPQLVLAAALAGLALAIGGGGLFALVLPQRDQVAQLKQKLSAAEAQLVIAHTPTSTSALRSAGVNAVDLFRLMEAMPNQVEMPLVMRDLSALAEASRVTIQQLRPSPPVPLASGYTAVPLVVDVAGSYAQIVGFLRDLRVAVQDPSKGLSVDGRLLIVNGMQLQSTDGQSVTATLNLDAFEYGAPPVASATAGATPVSTTTTGSSAG